MIDYAEHIRKHGDAAVNWFRRNGNREAVLRQLAVDLHGQTEYSDRLMSASSRQKAAEILFISSEHRSAKIEPVSKFHIVIHQ